MTSLSCRGHRFPAPIIPYTVTVEDAGAPPQSLEFFFWGGGLVGFPIVLIYATAV